MAQLPLHPTPLLSLACLLPRVTGKSCAAIVNLVVVAAAAAFGSNESSSGVGRSDLAVRSYGLPSFWSLRYLAHDSSDHVAQSSESAAAAVSAAKSGRLVHFFGLAACATSLNSGQRHRCAVPWSATRADTCSAPVSWLGRESRRTFLSTIIRSEVYSGPVRPRSDAGQGLLLIRVRSNGYRRAEPESSPQPYGRLDGFRWVYEGGGNTQDKKCQIGVLQR